MTAPLPPTGINIFNLLGARFPHLRRRAFSHHSGASLRATGSREVLRVPSTAQALPSQVSEAGGLASGCS
jgi:hypothetical protein